MQIVKHDETRAQIYAINALKAQQERSKFDVHMHDKVRPLLGRRCVIPQEIVNMPVSAQAEFLNRGELSSGSVEGVVLKSAGGGLVWIYIFAERMPFRFWMADAQGWLSDDDKRELGLPIVHYEKAAAAKAAAADDPWKNPEPLPDLNAMYGAGKAVSAGEADAAGAAPVTPAKGAAPASSATAAPRAARRRRRRRRRQRRRPRRV